MKKRINNLSLTKTNSLCIGFCLFLLLLFNCNKKDDLSANDIVKKAVQSHGGLSAWEKVKQLSFDKQTILYNQDGSIESKIDQFQVFRFQPKLFGKIEWTTNLGDILIISDDGKITKTINDSIITSKSELIKTKNAFFAAEYVIKQPFALLDKGVKLTNNGIENIGDKPAYVISVSYKNDTKDSNKWLYYIDTESFEVLANKVILKNHTSWVENLTFNTKTDFKFYENRKSYRLNEVGEKTYLRAEYYYSNFMVIY